MLSNGPAFKKLISSGLVDAILARDGPPLLLGQIVGSCMGSLGSPQPGQEASRNGSGHCSSYSDDASRSLGICLRSIRSSAQRLAPLQAPPYIHSFELLALHGRLDTPGRIARARKIRRDAEALKPADVTAKDNLPNMNGPRRILQQFLNTADSP